MRRNIYPLTMLIIIIMVLAGIGYYFFNSNFSNNEEQQLEEQFHPKQEPYNKSIIITEINYLGTHDFFEIFVSSGSNLTISNLIVETLSSEYELPELFAIDSPAFIPVYFGSGDNQLNGSKESVRVYIGLDDSDTLGDSGELILKTTHGTIIDYVRWGGKNIAFTEGYWRTGDFGAIANPGESLQLFGEDTNSSENWMSSTPTPGLRSAIEFEAYPDLEVLIEDGKTAYPFKEGEFSRPGFRTVVPLDIRNDTHAPANASETLMIKEMINFTLNFYKNQGFPSPVVSSNGKLIVTLIKKTTPGSEGSASPNGRFVVRIPTPVNRLDLKVTVEHEMFHLVQWHKWKENNETYNNMPNPAEENNWWEEGMAEYWGVRSTMANYNMTMEQVKNGTRKAGTANWWDNARDLNLGTFYRWGYDWDDYEISFQFIKYLMEKYGKKTVIKIHNTTREYPGNESKRINAKQALEKVLNKTLDEVLAEFYEWRVFDRQNKTMPEVNLYSNLTFGTPGTINDTVPLLNKTLTENAQPGGALVQRFNLNGSRVVKFNFTTPQKSNWTIIAKLVHKDGTNTVVKGHTSPSGLILYTNPNNTLYVIVIKIRQLNSSDPTITIKMNEEPGSGISDPRRIKLGECIYVHLPWYGDNKTYFTKMVLEESATLNFTLVSNPLEGNFDFVIIDYTDPAFPLILFNSSQTFKEAPVKSWVATLEFIPTTKMILYVLLYATFGVGTPMFCVETV